MVATNTQQQKQPAPMPNKMTLDRLVVGKKQQPVRVLLYGVEGIGKSTFGASAPRPIFIGAEDGTAHLDVARFPMPETWQDVRDAIRTLTVDPHDFQTLVIDTLDHAEPLLWAHICKRDNMPNVEAYGYGKGYQAALDEWRVLLADLERLRAAKKMNLIFLAHSWIKSFKNPEGDDFDRYELKLNAKASGLIKENVDAVLFANYETFASKDAKTKRVKGVSTGARFIYTTRTAAYDAKNRYDLPESMPLDWTEFKQAVDSHTPASVGALLAEIQRKAEKLPAIAEKVAEGIKRAGGDAAKLAQLNTWANAKLLEGGIAVAE